MTDVEVQAPDGKFRAALEQPSGTGPWPGVVLLHDAFGLNDDHRAIARRVADNGYLAIVPDLYARGGALRCMRTVFGDMMRREGRTFADILATRDYLANHPDCTGKVAVAGFCLGGGFALLVAPKGFNAAAPFYPSLRASFDEVVDGACPIVASFGKRDPVNIRGEEKLARALDKRGIEHDIKTYPRAGHGFANTLPAQPLARITGLGHNAAATDDAWRRVFAFFDTHLRDG